MLQGKDSASSEFDRLSEESRAQILDLQKTMMGTSVKLRDGSAEARSHQKALEAEYETDEKGLLEAREQVGAVEGQVEQSSKASTKLATAVGSEITGVARDFVQSTAVAVQKIARNVEAMVSASGDQSLAATVANELQKVERTLLGQLEKVSATSQRAA